MCLFVSLCVFVRVTRLHFDLLLRLFSCKQASKQTNGCDLTCLLSFAATNRELLLQLLATLFFSLSLCAIDAAVGKMSPGCWSHCHVGGDRAPPCCYHLSCCCALCVVLHPLNKLRYDSDYNVSFSSLPSSQVTIKLRLVTSVLLSRYHIVVYDVIGSGADPGYQGECNCPSSQKKHQSRLKDQQVVSKTQAGSADSGCRAAPRRGTPGPGTRGPSGPAAHR